tara:strand:+ start:8354 stop:10822 length:2469 start_codon:yes stop_codon:yes gene_type:complete
MAYNLLGQQGTKGTRNPDPNLSDAEATYLYDNAPGDGDNKGVMYTSFGNQIVDVEAHNKKADEVATEQSRDSKVKPGSSVDLSNTSFGEKESVDVAEVLPPITSKERKSIKSFSDLAKLTSTKRLDENDINLLLGLNPEWTREDINQIIAGESIPWWQQMGFDSIDEADSEFGRGSLDIKDYEKFKKEQDEIDKALENRSTTTTTTSTTSQANIPAYQVTIYKDGQEKTLDVRDPQLQSFLNDNWSTEKTVGSTTESAQFLASTQVTIYKDGQEKNVDFRTVSSYVTDGWSTDKTFVPVPSSDLIDTPTTTSSQDFVSDQVIVLGPNGARTTAQKNKRPGEDMSEYDRLIAGLIPGREGYKNADKIDYVDTYGGHSTGESVTGDYKGDYGGEDASTPDSERESKVGAGNTGYDNKDYSLVETETTQSNTFVPSNLDLIELNNIPVGAEVWDVEGTLYLAYAVPGAGDLYTGSTIWMAYDVVGNDLFEAGLLTEGFEYKGPNGSPSKSWFDTTAILSGNSNQLIGMDSDPFASFVETYKEEALLRPWLLDNEFIELQAEAALEDRDISEAEWRATTWYQTNNQAKRDWMDIELSDPAEAQRQRDDLELYYKNQLQGLGVSNVPDGLIQWVSSQNITGSWSDLKTAEQLQLFADPYKTGERDGEMLNLISTSGFGDVDRTSAREKEVVELYRKWLGPSLGSLTQDEVSSIAGRLRDDPDYEDALVNSLKQSRLAAFSNYSNPELTYEDIARPWRNLTTSVWGQTADETQGWWQEMLKSNDYSTAQTTLREKGLEQNINQVSVDASQALQNALGQGSVSQSGVNV